MYSKSPRADLYHCPRSETYSTLACANLGLARAQTLLYNRQIVLFDFQAALKALDSFKINSKLVRECLNALSELASYSSMHIGWVPGHVALC